MSQQLQLTSTTNAAYYGVRSQTVYDLTGSSVTNKVINAGNQKITSFEVYPVNIGPDSNNQLSWYISGGNIIAKKKIAGVQTTLKTAAYSANTHKYFRIRESSGTVYWDYSTNGTSWANFTSLADPFSLNAVYIEQMIGTWQNESKTTSAVLDNVNIAP